MSDYKMLILMADSGEYRSRVEINGQEFKWQLTKNYLDYDGKIMVYSEISDIMYDEYKSSSATFKFKGKEYKLHRNLYMSEERYKAIISALQYKKRQIKEDEINRKNELEKQKKNKRKAILYSSYAFLVVIVIIGLMLFGGGNNSNNILDKTRECPVCHREFTLDSENAKSIRKANMCKQCLKNYNYTRELPINK